MSKLVRVLWDDGGAFSMDESWMAIEDIVSSYHDTSFVCTTVGYLIYEDKDSLIISQNYQEEFCQYAANFRIPRGMVKDIVYLEGDKQWHIQ